MQNPDVVQRLKSIEGHVRGVEKMVEDGAYCIDVLHQIQAVHAALNKVSTLILDDHLNNCVVTAIRSEDLAKRERVLSEIADIFEAAKKV
jgi:DNA-binding FrmR family transcriptional regulator